MWVGLLLATAVGVARAQNAPASFSINSPRSEVDTPPPPVLVKLPDDLEAVLNLQKQDRSRIHASILGLPSRGSGSEPGQPPASIEDILREEPPARSPAPPPTVPPTPARRPPAAPTRSTPRPEDPRPTPAGRDEAAAQPGDEAEDEAAAAGQRSFWTIAWEAHIYFSGTLFVLLSVYCFVNILRLHTFSRLFSRGYFVALNLSIIGISVLRPIYLFRDPYNLNLAWPRMGGYLLLDTGYPCITTAFAVLFLALLRATQVELVSPAFQTPKSLAIFCGIHLALTIALDVGIGLMVQIRYTILIGQGFFIVWSLLLSAGYFYIFSPMKKIAMRPGADLLRTMYPKLVLDGVYHGMDPRAMEPHYLPNPCASVPSPPLARAIHLTLGVAVIASLMGGVQLFGMIKMLGLQKVDMSPRQNEWAWFGYQVAMRILEVTICTLLAVITTTPLRTEPPDGRSASPPSRFALCCHGNNPPRELEDEIYSEICTNNHSVRHMMMVNNGGGPHGPGIMDTPYGTLGPNGRLSTLGRMGQHYPPDMEGNMMAMENLNHSALGLTVIPSGPSPQPLGTSMMAPMNHKRATSSHSSNSNPNSTLRTTGAAGNYQDVARGSGLYQTTNSGSSSRATVDTALYSNLKGGGSSRPSSMLFNDSGFVRFRLGDDPNLAQDDVLRQSTSDLVESSEMPPMKMMMMTRPGPRNFDPTREKLRASQSFDDSVLLMDRIPGLDGRKGGYMDKLSPASQPETSFADLVSKKKPPPPTRLSEAHRQSPIYKSIDSIHSDPELDELGGEISTLYEPPPGMKLDKIPPGAMANIYSEDDMSSVYGRSQIYRPPSRCSSISATQSFDMRMYGQSGGNPGKSGPAPQVNAQGFIIPSQTTGPEGPKEKKLENPYYYYGSTRNQKKQINQKPRPLLPSQRQQLESAQKRQGRPSSRQAVVQDVVGSSATMDLPGHFQRSRSLGGYYNRGPPPKGAPPPPAGGYPVQQAAGSMTPISYSRWQHAQRQEEMPRRHNPLYDTPPTLRHAHALINPRMRVGQLGELEERVGGRLSQQDGFHRNAMVRPHPMQPQSLRLAQQAPSDYRYQPELLSPILADHEGGASPLHCPSRPFRPGTGALPPQRLSNPSEFLRSSIDDSEDVHCALDQFTAHGEGYSEGLADNESEVSSVYGPEPPKRHWGRPAELENFPPDHGQPPSHAVSPLEYSAMLKLYGPTPNGGAFLGSKDVTPDSGVHMEPNSDSNKSKKEAGRSGLAVQRAASQDTGESRLNKPESRQSLLSSSSSLNDLLKPSSSKATAIQGGKEYSRIDPGGRMSTVFSSSSESESDQDDPHQAPATAVDGGKQYQSLQSHNPDLLGPGGKGRPSGFRWDGSKMDKSGDPGDVEALASEHSDLGATGDTDDFSEVGESMTEEDGVDESDEDPPQPPRPRPRQTTNLAF